MDIHLGGLAIYNKNIFLLLFRSRVSCFTSRSNASEYWLARKTNSICIKKMCTCKNSENYSVKTSSSPANGSGVNSLRRRRGTREERRGYRGYWDARTQIKSAHEVFRHLRASSQLAWTIGPRKRNSKKTQNMEDRATLRCFMSSIPKFPESGYRLVKEGSMKELKSSQS
jgi:hypothetical protein